jgi:Ca2+-binding RTX toxin-like protein
VRILLVTTALLAPTVLLPLAGPSEAAAPASCHGVRATIVGHPGDNLLGTKGRDVVVTNGARGFRGEGGDDLVCVTGDARFLRIQTLNGDDRIYVQSRHTETAFNGRLGSDQYHGNGANDDVFVRLDGDDLIETAGGHDFVELRHGPHPGRTHVDAGSGDDDVYVEAGDIRGEIVGSGGTNWLHIAHHSRAAWRFDNLHGQARTDHDLRFRWQGFTHFDLEFLVVPTLTFIGSNVGELVSANYPGGGKHTAGTYSMGAGDDQVIAGDGDDVIDGGDGADTADGEGGTDTCVAEVRSNCELP